MNEIDALRDALQCAASISPDQDDARLLRSAADQIERLIKERDQALSRLGNAQEILEQAGVKLALYRAQHSGDYIGGVEYTELMKRISDASAKDSVVEIQNPSYQCDCGETFGSQEERAAHMVDCYTQLGARPPPE